MRESVENRLQNMEKSMSNALAKLPSAVEIADIKESIITLLGFDNAVIQYSLLLIPNLSISRSYVDY